MPTGPPTSPLRFIPLSCRHTNVYEYTQRSSMSAQENGANSWFRYVLLFISLSLSLEPVLEVLDVIPAPSQHYA